MTENVPVQLLYAFVVFADSDSLEQAARQTGVTQPALSKQLKNLQTHFSTSLFASEGRRKILTAFGRRLYQNLQPRLQDLQEIVGETVRAEAPKEQVELRLAARQEILDRLADQIFFPGKITFLEFGHDQILEALRRRQADLGITHALPDSHEFTARSLFREKFHLVCPQSLSRQTNPENLQSLPCLAYKENDEVLHKACDRFGLQFKSLRLHRVIADYSLIARMVEAGRGWSVIPAHLPQNREKIWSLDLPSVTFSPREFQALYRSEYAKTPWMRDLVQEIGLRLKSPPATR
jgi:DNA-binding transcriptional LysR family regulator